MGRIFYVMGRSASGKDTIYQALLGMEELALKPLVLYTTRPIRSNETEGVEYHFVDEKGLAALKGAGKVIELREYHTVQGLWTYFTADDGSVDLETQSYLAIGTPVSFAKLKDYYGEARVLPVYIEVEEALLLERALKRERKQERPDYREMCRRFLADAEDFSGEKLAAAGITRRFPNNGEREECIREAAAFIRKERKNN